VIAGKRVKVHLEKVEAEKGEMPSLPLEFEKWCLHYGASSYAKWVGLEYERYLETKRLQMEEWKHRGRYTFREFKFDDNFQ
jgi:hypothetical protein